MSSLPDIVQHHSPRRTFSPFESWVRQSLRNRFTMVSNENLPPEILLQIDDAYVTAHTATVGHKRTGG
ncbi:hypothetical protein D3W54_05360 [Komagataeibacter medellinensis]|uniref:Uncharacterized protein n=2 Tax=Komagataeibacter medellinensis TaxID=1177712 RepID=G2I7E1_KOMMN|nr:hypothetical protein [Komagataeibacter medellinensis]KAB8123730.1 hypothetical protein D3W54_05360 [Komagataeibacter medellinensis]BAK84038.1 hypothetical protein GLX_16260 [Komagataeibacter medellinensis NBRC 3288]